MSPVRWLRQRIDRAIEVACDGLAHVLFEAPPVCDLDGHRWTPDPSNLTDTPQPIDGVGYWILTWSCRGCGAVFLRGVAAEVGTPARLDHRTPPAVLR